VRAFIGPAVPLDGVVPERQPSVGELHDVDVVKGLGLGRKPRLHRVGVQLPGGRVEPCLDRVGRLELAIQPLLAARGSPPAVRQRPAAEVRADLIRAGMTMTVSRDEIRRQLEAAAQEEM